MVAAKWCQTIHNFSYKNSTQTFTSDCDGYYKVELWGAQGGDGLQEARNLDRVVSNTTGLGGYTSGNISLTENTPLYIHTGEKGITATYQGEVAGRYNGGGSASGDNDNDIGGTGGGATDIRTSNGEWNDTNGLRSRIMVAGGGGGSNGWTISGGWGGGLVGGTTNSTYSMPGSQTSGYKFGIGQNGKDVYNDWGMAGGGGGWYGGKTSSASGNYSGAGGSSYISGMSGSIAVTSAGTAKCSAGSVSVSCSESWTGYKIVAGTALMIDGAGHKWPEGSSSAESGYTQMPNPNGGYNANGVGHSGNGYARIIYLGDTI